jgi:ribonuclease HII
MGTMSDAPTTHDSTVTIVGIDEAGYGPLLGPLVVSATAFDVPVSFLESAKDPAIGPNLWDLLGHSVCKKSIKKDPRLAVADSKKLHGKSDTPLRISLLERAALTFLAQAERNPANLVSLLRIVCPHAVDHLCRYPWYDKAELTLPAECSADDIMVQRNALAGDLAANGVQFRGVWVEALCEGHYNDLVAATHNKASVLFQLNMRLIHRIAERMSGRPLLIWADRHGGRTSYLRPLMNAWPDAEFQVLEESPERSGYKVTRAGVPWTIRFLVEGESYQLPIALASIFSKYIRELFMACFNRYWCGQVPGLRPTAGYYQDGQRFLADIEAVLTRQGLDRKLLVRML